MFDNMSKIPDSALGPAQAWAGGLKQSFCFAPDFIGFKGHFPGNPLLPAVVQLQLGVLLAAQLAGRPLVPASLTRAKFTHPVKPGDILEVYCAASGNNRYTVSIMLNNHIKAAAFTITAQEDYADQIIF
jgi:3-hydroxyacyl-[acyl-carrier-protein] dehydratase